MAEAAVTYEFYEESFGGSAISEDDWEGYASKAGAYLAKLEALCSVTPYAEKGREMALCAVAEQYQNFDVAAGASGQGSVKGASIGSVSATYDATAGGAVDLSPAGQRKSLLDAAGLYLHVYAGVG